jgi:hypothetical protein
MPRHNEFTNSQMRDMIVIYVEERFSGRAAKRRYEELYPNRRQPSHTLFAALFRRLGESGSFKPAHRNGRNIERVVDQEEDILDRVEEDPEISIRRLSVATGVSRNSVSTVLHTQQLRCFHFTPVQNLLPPDFVMRQTFCERILEIHNRDHTFIGRIAFTDEATFTRRGVFNWRNSHVWSEENPHVIKEHHFQHEFSINVWCGIIGNCILGPVALPDRLNGAGYLNFLQNHLPEVLEEVPLNIRQRMWFQHDGAPAHNAIIARHHLNHEFPRRWIGRGSEFPWPARSPDLNPLDFYFWGHIKEIVYAGAPPNTREELWERIQNAGQQIRNNFHSFPVLQNFIVRLRKCVEMNGGHVEHLL